jgi:hypothetical protein
MVVVAETRVLPPELQAMAERVVAALQQKAENFTAVGATPNIVLAEAKFTRVIDPGNQLPGYEGVWRNARNDRCGTLTINSDNSFFAEYDLFCPHPRDTSKFVEMVTAWGNETTIRSEAQLIPNL